MGDDPKAAPRMCPRCGERECGGPCYGVDCSGPDGYDFECTASIDQECDHCFYVWCNECKKKLIRELGFEMEEPKMETFLTPVELTKLDAIRYAKERTEREGRQFVARTNGHKFFVVPLYEADKEGLKVDAGYAEIGPLLEEP